MNTLTPLFDLGQVVATPGALKAVSEAGQTPMDFLARHVSGDWGKLNAYDAAQNNEAVIHGNRLLSAYILNSGMEIWIITEFDRSSTCLLLQEEH